MAGPVFNVTIGFKQPLSCAVYPPVGLFKETHTIVRGGVTELVKLNEG